MRQKPEQMLYHIPLQFPANLTRTVKIKAASREVAEKRALKRNPGALRVKRA